MSVRADRPVEFPSEMNYPPRTIYDEKGEVVGIILAYPDYQTFLRILARYADWEKLPLYLQDAIDNMLADEVEAENGEARPLRELLTESGDLS